MYAFVKYFPIFVGAPLTMGPPSNFAVKFIIIIIIIIIIIQCWTQEVRPTPLFSLSRSSV